MSKKPNALVVAALAAALTAIAGPALAMSIGFTSISQNNATDSAIAAAQITVDVTDAGNGQVLFLFLNSGPAASSITDVYFHDGAVLASAFLDNSDVGVDFVYGAQPGNLPGGNSLGFSATQAFSSGAPRQQNGVNPGESLGILFDLQSGVTYADIIDDLTDASLRIGLKVQGFDSGDSESLVNTPIPEPGTMVGLATFGIAAFAGHRWRRANAQPA